MSWIKNLADNVLTAVVRKEFLHVLRDRRTLIMIVLMPMIQLIIYGYAVQTDVKHLATAVYNEDQSPVSRRLLDAFEQSEYFDITRRVQSPHDLRRLIDRGKVKAGFHFGPEFSERLLSGRQASLQILIDGTDSTPANTALNTSQAIVTAFMQREGFIPVTVSPIDVRPRMWYNPDLKSSLFMVPGLVGLLLQLLIPMITATAIVREKERGNIEQLLVTPIGRRELILGKLIPYVVIGLVIALSIIGAARLLFDVHIRGNPITLFLLTFLFLVVCLGIGLFASTVAENQQQASTIVMMIAPPSILLSGFIFPRESMPLPIYGLGYFIPLTYFLKIVRGIVLKGLGLRDLWMQIVPLASMAVGIMWLSVVKFRKRLT